MCCFLECYCTWQGTFKIVDENRLIKVELKNSLKVAYHCYKFSYWKWLWYKEGPLAVPDLDTIKTVWLQTLIIALLWHSLKTTKRHSYVSKELELVKWWMVLNTRPPLLCLLLKIIHFLSINNNQCNDWWEIFLHTTELQIFKVI